MKKYSLVMSCIVHHQKIFTLAPQKGLEFPRELGMGVFCKAKKIKEMYEV